MTLKQLFKKIEDANEISEMAHGSDNYSIYIAISGCTQYRLDNESMWFKTYEQAIASIKEDWNDNVSYLFEKMPLKKTHRNKFTIENNFVTIEIGVCN